MDYLIRHPDICLTEYQIDAVKALMGEKTLDDTLKAIREYEARPMDADMLAKGMFAYGVAYAAGRIYMRSEDEP